MSIMTKMLTQQKQKTTEDSGEGSFDSHLKHLCYIESSRMCYWSKQKFDCKCLSTLINLKS